MTTHPRFAALVLLGVVACKKDTPPPELPVTTSVAGQSPSLPPPTHSHRAAPITTTGMVPMAPPRVAPADPVRETPAAARTVTSGTRIDATMQDSVYSLHGRAGQTVRAIVSGDVMGSTGAVVIPAGSALTLTIEQIQAAENSSDSDGAIVLSVTSVNVRGTDYQLSADLQSVPHLLIGHGVTLGSAEKVAVGAVIGAVAGRIIGHTTAGTVIGGAIGAAGGIVVASHTQDRDVLITPGTPIVMALNQPLQVAP